MGNAVYDSAYTYKNKVLHASEGVAHPMNEMEQLAKIVFNNSLKRFSKRKEIHPKLEFIGKGRSASVYKIKNSSLALKVFYPNYTHLAIEEGEIYRIVNGNAYFPKVYEIGEYYIVIDYIEGTTLFDCLTKGIPIKESYIKEIDQAILSAKQKGLNPSDIHLKNIILTTNHQVKIIDLARFRQSKPCRQWSDLRKVFYQLYKKTYFPKKINYYLLNLVRILYKKLFIKIMIQTNQE